MCLIIFNWQPNSHRPLTLAANRDEFHMRASLDAHFWEDHPQVFAGRDLEKNGTWLGIAKNQHKPSFRLAALTNFRSLDKNQYMHSRGKITQNFLSSHESALNYAQDISFNQYAGFNALFFDGESLVYAHHEPNVSPDIITLKKGTYGLSNAKLNSPWPKVENSLKAFQTLTNDVPHKESAEHLLKFLRDDAHAEDSLLPDTGIGIDLERMLSPAFIISPSYGTRTASVVMIDQQVDEQSVYFRERQFSKTGENIRELVKQLS